MKKLVLKIVAASLMIVAATCIDANASPVDTNTVKVVAKNFLQKHDQSVKSTEIFRISSAARANGLSNLYIVERTDKAGFVVISADDCVQPVLAYSATNVAGDEIPVNALDWFRGYDGEIAYCVANNVQSTEEVRFAWEELKGTKSNAAPKQLNPGAGISLPTRPLYGTPVVGPLLTTTWNQAPLYNNYCPYDNVRGARTVVGCVATAMAQVMKYWNYPTRGVGSNSYYDTVGGTLSVNFGNTTYDWANMPNALVQSSTAAQIHAVATLSYHCGVAVNMDYGVSAVGGSGAYTTGNYYTTAEYALKTFFGYKNTLASDYRYYYSDAQWNALLRSELNANRPLLHSGRGTGGGHAFVCDGYDSDGLFHYNWGWAGSYDGFFASNNLAPGGGGIGSNQSNTFNQNQAVVYGIEPDNSSLVIRPELLTVSPMGGNETVSVRTANSDTNRWRAINNYPWMTLSANSGVGSGNVANVTVTVEPNLTGYNRQGSITFIQNTDTVVLPVVQTYGNNSSSGQYGNTAANYLTLVDSGYFVAMRPERFGNFNAGDTIKSIYYRTYDHSQYPDYMDSNFVIRIYENPVFTSALAQGSSDNFANVFGNPVYTQSYVQSRPGEQEVNLTTPYVINSNNFWITFTSVGKSQLLWSPIFIEDSVLESNFPLVDSVDGKYLHGYYNMYVRPSYSGIYADDTNYLYQYNSHYVFGFSVKTGSQTLVSARPDTAGHGYVLGGGAYNVGDTVTLQAFALPGYSFVRWSDSVSTSTRTFVIQPNTYYPEFVAIYYARTSYTLSVTTATPQLGTTTGSGRYYAGDTVSAIAIPVDSTRYFVRWNDNNTTNPRRFAINANTQLVATFATRATSTITVHDTIHDTTYINVAVHDTVHDTAYINLPQHNFNINSANSAQGVTVGTGTYPQGLRIGIAAVPTEGYRFSHWSDNNTDNPRHFTVSGAVTLTAHFTASAQGVHTPDKSVAVDIYPNPTTGFITLSQFAERVEVLDNWGRLVAVAENVINMDLSDLADGTYTLRISTQGTVVLKKVVKR